MSYRERVLKAFKEGKIIYYDSEYCFPEAAKKTEWRYKPAKLRVQVFKVGNKPLEVYDVWKTGHYWDRIFQLLEEGYFLVAHNAIADVRPDLCDDRILKYLFNAQVLDTIYMERLVHGMTNPVNADTLESEDDEEREDEPEVGKLSTPFALDSLIKRYTGTIIKKTYQDARNYLKSELSEAVLEYASNDVKYLPAILEAQLDKIDILGLWDVVELNHELLASSYIIKAQGIPIDMKELARYRTELKTKSDEIEIKLLEILPRVQYTTTQLIDIYFDTFWVKGKGLCGVLSKVKAKDIVKKGENHALTSTVLRWVDENRDKITRAVNLRSSGQRLQAFNQMGYKLSSTSETVLREFSSKFHAPVIDKYLEWQKTNSLLTKVLNNMTYDKYLRKDNTVPSTFTWVKALNGRSSSQDMNVQQLPRELKSLYGTPVNKIKIEYDYCLHPDTELLTSTGWKKVLDIELNDLVWQVNPGTLKGSFTNPQRVIKQDYKGVLYWIGNARGVLGVTENHTMLYGAQQSKRPDFRAIRKSQEGFRNGEVLLTSSLQDIVSDYTSDEINTICMLQADAHFTRHGSYVLQLANPRKREEARRLLGRSGKITQRSGKLDIESWYGIKVDSPLLQGKSLKLMTLGGNQAEQLKSCLEFWDGTRDHGDTTRYFSTQKDNIDEVQSYFVRSGYEANIKECRKVSEKHKQCYSVNIRLQKGIRLRPETDILEEQYEGKVGCVTVSEGFILVRYKGQTFITGNCAIELMKLLNDFPVNELTPLLFDDKEDIHLYNAATFFNRDYEELKQLHKQKDPVVKQLRNAAKTVIYFLQYKTPKYAEDKYVTGTNKLIEIFNNGLDWQLEKEAAESLIITGERILHRWTTEKINMDKDIIKLANSNILLDSVLLSHIKNSKEDIDMAINEGIIYFHGALNMFYKFDLLQDNIYSPEKTEWDESREEYRLRREYINNRSLYSCRIAGPVAIAAKQAVRKAQKILHERFGYLHAWIGLFIHDSMTAYCHKDIASQVDEIVRVCMLEEMYNIAGFSNVPVYIEGAIDGEPEKKYGYHDGRIMTF